jgi:Lipocalin-like domain
MPNISQTMMVRRALTKVALTAFVTSAVGHVALAQQETPQSSVLGTWMLVSEVAHQGGKTTQPLGSHPVGSMMLDQRGRFMLMIARRDLPKFAANKREAGTADENKAVLAGSLSFFGTYSVGAGVLTLRPEASTFPNWVGTDQKRYFTIAGDEMKWTNRAPAIAAQVAELVWKRVQ